MEGSRLESRQCFLKDNGHIAKQPTQVDAVVSPRERKREWGLLILDSGLTQWSLHCSWNGMPSCSTKGPNAQQTNEKYKQNLVISVFVGGSSIGS